MKLETFFVAGFLAVVSLVMMPAVVLAGSGACSSTATGGVPSDLEIAPPSLDGLRLVSVKKAAFSGYTRSWLPFSPWKLYKIEGKGLDGEEREYLSNTISPIPSLRPNVRVATFPSLNLRLIRWGPTKFGHEHIAVENFAGTKLYVIEESNLVRVESSTEARKGALFTAVNILRCSNDKITVVQQFNLPQPIKFDRNLYGPGGLDCK